jgi:hypothetical protein
MGGMTTRFFRVIVWRVRGEKRCGYFLGIFSQLPSKNARTADPIEILSQEKRHLQAHIPFPWGIIRVSAHSGDEKNEPQSTQRSQRFFWLKTKKQIVLLEWTLRCLSIIRD